MNRPRRCSPASSCRAPYPRTRRSGHSLTELMIVVTLVGLALSGVSTTLVTLVRVDRGMREQQQRSARWGELAYRFRSDVRAAVDAAPEPTGADANLPQPTALKLDLGQGRTIEYRGESQRVERIVREGDQVVHRDSFRLGRSQSATFQRLERAGRAVWVLAVTTDAAQGGQYEGTSRIEATLGTHSLARAGRSRRARRPRRRAARRNARRGTVLAVALVGFLVVALFASAVTYRVVLSARQVRSSRFAAQAEWLVESGAQRAKAQMVASPEYAGETWSVEASEFGAAGSGRSGAVVIAVTRDAGDAAARRVLVTATYPADSPLLVRRQLEFNWQPTGSKKTVNE